MSKYLTRPHQVSADLPGDSVASRTEPLPRFHRDGFCLENILAAKPNDGPVGSEVDIAIIPVTKTITTPLPQLRHIFENARGLAGQLLHQVHLPRVQIFFDLANKFALESVVDALLIEGSLVLMDREAGDLFQFGRDAFGSF